MVISVRKNRRLRVDLEVFFWVSGLIVLYFSFPFTDQHFSLCIYHLMGFEHCLGCGIGKSMSCAMHGEIEQSFNYHYLGIAALLGIVYRIFLKISISKPFIYE